MGSGTDREAPSDPALIGRIVRPHGLAGEVVVEPLDSSPSPFVAGAALWVGGGWRSVERCRLDTKGRWVIALEGIADRDAAERLRNSEVVIEAVELPQLEGDRFYVHDLIGCRVEDGNGEDLGEVVGVVSGPQDLLEVEHDGERSLLPMARALLREVDVQGRRIVIDAPPGLSEATRA